MSPIPSLEKLSEAFRAKDGKIPAIFCILGDDKGSQSYPQTWLAAAKYALSRDEPERCRSILEAFRESNQNHIGATLLLSKACLQLGSEDALDESVVLARKAAGSASSSDEALQASVQLAVSLGSRARVHTRQQTERQHDRDEAIQVLSELDVLTSSLKASPARSGESPSSGADASTQTLVAHGLYTLALLQAERGGSHMAPAGVAALAAWHAAQAARDAQLTALSLVLVANILSSRQGDTAALAWLTKSSSVAVQSPLSSPSSSQARHSQWGDVLVCRLRSRLLAALSDAAGSMEALASAKWLLSSWLEGQQRGGEGGGGGELSAGVSRSMAEEALAKVWSELAVAMASSGQSAEAMAAADQALALRPWTAACRHALGVVHEALGQYDEAAAVYDDALALDPTHAPTLLRKGSLHARRGSLPDLAVARDLLAEALSYDPRAAAGWHELGRVAGALEHRSQAEEYMLTAVRLASEAPVLEYGEMPLAPPAAYAPAERP